MNNFVTLFVCPRCQTRCLRDASSGDFVHTCQGTDALKNESIIVIGPWVDYTGSDTSVQNALMKGTENILQGTRAGVEGATFYPRDANGYPKNMYRRRQHLQYLPPEQFNNKSNSEVPDNPQEYEFEDII